METEADKARNDLLDLVESLKTKRILTGTIQGIERPADHPSRSLAVIYHGDIKVIIPAEEAVEPPEDFRGRLPEDVLHYMVTKRLGAEVDYIIKGIDAKAGVAVGSRLEAMSAKRRAYYFGTDRDGNNLLYEGICAEARVVSVIRAGIFVDLFGLEVYIPLRELSYQRMLDAQDSFQPGQRMLDYDLTRAEQVRRTDLAQKARRMILSHMKVEAEDETSLTLDHRGYYMQISFSPLHPLLVVCLAKAIRNPDGARKQQLANELNLHSVLGSHAINEDVGCYSYRATHWLDTELTPERFFEILSRCVDEADRGYFNLAG